MSYCRFSSDNFQSDVYVYADCGGGFTTHVASNRQTLPPTFPSEPDISTPEKYIRHHKKLMKILNKIPRTEIKNEYAGKTYNDVSPKECAERLLAMRASGLNVPQCAIDRLMEEETSDEEESDD